MKINYTDGEVVQAFEVRDGVALGYYLPPPNSGLIFLSGSGDNRLSPRSLSFFSQASSREQIDALIEKEARVQVTLGHDAQIEDALKSLVEAVAEDLKFSSKFVAKSYDLLKDSKDSLKELYSTGEVKPETMLKLIATTLVKNATPEEHEKLVEAFFDNKIPEAVEGVAIGSGTAAERQYSAAMIAVTRFAVEKLFPISSGFAKVFHAAGTHAIDIIRDDSLHAAYSHYKNGDFDLTKLSAVIRSKIRSLLKAKGDNDITSDEIEAYARNLFDGWINQEPEMLAYKQKLEQVRDAYLQLSEGKKRELDTLLNYRWTTASETERFKKFFELYSTTYSQLKGATLSCPSVPTDEVLRSKVVSLVNTAWLSAQSESAANEAFTSEYIDFLKAYECTGATNSEDSEEVPEASVYWRRVDTIQDFELINSHDCYTRTLSGGSGSVSYQDVTNPACFSGNSTTFSATGQWTSPPSTLVPGDSFSLSFSINRGENSWNGGGFYLAMDIDNAGVLCGGGTGGRVAIDYLRVTGGGSETSDSATVTIEVTEQGLSMVGGGSYNADSFAIRACFTEGGVRYTYEKVE